MLFVQKWKMKMSNLSPMQQEMLNRADSIISSIGIAASKASDLALEGGQVVVQQIPEIAQHYILYGRAVNSMYVIISFVLLYIAYHLFSHSTREDILQIFGAIVCMIYSVVIFAEHIKSFFMVWFAPKIWLLIEVVNLVKTIKG